MTTAAPATIANDLLAQLEHLFGSDATPSPLVLARLERDATALQKRDAVHASMVRAGIAALKWDFEETQRWVNNSLRLDSSVPCLTNSALTYRQFNRFDLSCELLRQCYDRAPRDGVVVSAYLESLHGCGRFVQSTAVYQLAQKQGVEIKDHRLNDERSIRFMTEAGIAAARLEFEVQCALQVLARNHKRTTVSELNLFEDPDGVPCLVLQYFFSGDFMEEMRMESELAQLLADEPGWNPCTLSVELKYAVESHADEPV